MAADPAGHPASAGLPEVPTPRARLRWLGVVVAVMTLLTAGWQLLNLTVSDNLALTRAATFRIGPSGPDSAIVTVGPGWSMRTTESNPARGYFSLRSGPAAVSVAYLSLAGRVQAAGLWAGLRAVLRIRNPGLTLGSPTAVTSHQGRAGLTGALTSARNVGAATIFVGPSRTFAIQLIVLAPRTARGEAALASTGRFVRSLIFPAGPP
jgi:hypothetical protein